VSIDDNSFAVRVAEEKLSKASEQIVISERFLPAPRSSSFASQFAKHIVTNESVEHVSTRLSETLKNCKSQRTRLREVPAEPFPRCAYSFETACTRQ